jgi:LuxR family maltose regulon positive regulatory protein
VLEARLASDRGQVDRATTLVARALRSASAEELRRPLVADGPWLRWFLDRDGSALRDLRPFAQSLVGHGRAASATSRPVPATSGETVLEQLTERETQVLELLAQMCSTDEIAAELFVSANTVKTHLKGIFRKYSVNRRVDAVRRGRELGLC